MANKLFVSRLDRITLVQKSGGKIAKHPDMRNGVVEFVKADGDDDWYADFTNFILNTDDEEIPEDWCEAFAGHIEKAGKKNYPDSRGPFAGPHNSFPIKTQADVYDAARLVGHAASPASVKAKIIRIAHRFGFSLPKSWQKKVKKADLIEAFKAATQWLAGDTSAVEEDDPEDVTKARPKANPMHSHTHSHVSTYGYGSYEHRHDHDHQDGVTPESTDHDTHETAHAHQHVSKAGETVTPEEAANLEADNKGLKADLEKAQESLKTLEAKVADLEKAAAEAKTAEEAAVKKAADAEAATQAAEKAKEEAVKKAESRNPMTAAPEGQVKKSIDIKDMSYDDALKALLHS